MASKRIRPRPASPRDALDAARKVTAGALSGESTLPFPPAYDSQRIASLRARLNLSQPVFAAALNVSPETVKKWEQGTRVPDGASLRLLELAERHPEWVLSAVRSGGDVGPQSNKITKPVLTDRHK